MSLSKKFIGIKDLLDEQRYRIQHLQDELIKQNVPGSNWYSYQNVYNLVNGAYPNDAYVFVFLSDFLNIDVKIILMRYSILEISKNDTAVDLGELKYKEKWYDILKLLKSNKNAINQISPYEIAWKLFQYQLVINQSNNSGNFMALLYLVEECKKNGMVGITLPQATVFKQIDQINKLLNEGHDVNEFDFGQRTGLMVAAVMNDFEMVKFLVEKGANNSFSDQDNFQASDLTTSKEIISFLKPEGKKDFFEKEDLINNNLEENSDIFLSDSTFELEQNNIEVENDFEIEISLKNKKEFIELSIENLLQNEQLSVRAYNCCRRADLFNVTDIVNYYWKNKSFMNISNCGLKAELELIDLVKRFSS